MGEHVVIVYLHEGRRELSLTARRETGARLDVVDEQMRDFGFDRHLIQQNLTKDAADRLKAEMRAEYEGRGYTYVERPRA